MQCIYQIFSKTPNNNYKVKICQGNQKDVEVYLKESALAVIGDRIVRTPKQLKGHVDTARICLCTAGPTKRGKVEGKDPVLIQLHKQNKIIIKNILWEAENPYKLYFSCLLKVVVVVVG